MVALNFSHQFAGLVETGIKRQTVRGVNNKAIAGCSLTFFQDQRTKACRKLGEAVCKSVTPISLFERVAQPHGNVALTGIYLEEFAQADGFDNYEEMWAFFKPRADENGEFHGKLIKW